MYTPGQSPSRTAYARPSETTMDDVVVDANDRASVRGVWGSKGETFECFRDAPLVGIWSGMAGRGCVRSLI